MKHHVQKTSTGQIPCLNRNWIPLGDINSAFLLLFTSYANPQNFKYTCENKI